VRQACRQTDILARLGGDEFAILIPELDVQDAVASLARRINDVLRKPYDIAGRNLSVTASVGAAEYCQQLVSIEALLARADEAMYRSKREGRDCFHVWMESQGAEQSPSISPADA
jgi:diguanylate cyclase (GGDEF)-like protein